MLIWHHGYIDRLSYKGSIYGSVTFWWKLIIHRLGLRKTHAQEMGCGYCWRVNKLSQQAKYPAELLRVNYRNSRALKKSRAKKKKKKI